jgi:hypothetical protein
MEIQKQDKQDNYNKEFLNKKYRKLFITIPRTTIDYNELHKDLAKQTQVTHIKSKLEYHEDKAKHIHILIHYKYQMSLLSQHKIIFKQEGKITGLIEYETPKDYNAVSKYLDKEETAVEPPIENGTKPKTKLLRPDEQLMLEALNLAKEGNEEEAMELIRQTTPSKYIIFNQQIKETLKQENKTIKKYPLPDTSQAILTDQQKEVWNDIQGIPKARVIHWITGEYGAGKTFLKNYIENNHEYGAYDAGQSASLDNVANAYNEEGIILWDLPKTYDFQEKGDLIANVIEKFSDYGTKISSKKYKGKTQHVRGHVVVFANRECINQLRHRTIKEYNLTQEKPKTQKTELEQEQQIIILDDY